MSFLAGLFGGGAAAGAAGAGVAAGGVGLEGGASILGMNAGQLGRIGKLLGGSGQEQSGGVQNPGMTPGSLAGGAGRGVAIPLEMPTIQMYDSPIATLSATRERLRRGRIEVPNVLPVSKSFNPSGDLTVAQITQALMGNQV